MGKRRLLRPSRPSPHPPPASASPRRHNPIARQLQRTAGSRLAGGPPHDGLEPQHAERRLDRLPFLPHVGAALPRRPHPRRRHGRRCPCLERLAEHRRIRVVRRRNAHPRRGQARHRIPRNLTPGDPPARRTAGGPRDPRYRLMGLGMGRPRAHQGRDLRGRHPRREGRRRHRRRLPRPVLVPRHPAQPQEAHPRRRDGHRTAVCEGGCSRCTCACSRTSPSPPGWPPTASRASPTPRAPRPSTPSSPAPPGPGRPSSSPTSSSRSAPAESAASSTTRWAATPGSSSIPARMCS